MKMARCIIELERIYGITHNGDRTSGNNFILKTQADLAEQLEVSQDTL